VYVQLNGCDAKCLDFKFTWISAGYFGIGLIRVLRTY